MALENQPLRVQAVIFDLDGTLIDTAPIYYQIIDIIFEKLAIPPVPKATLLEAMKDGEFDWDVVLPVRMKHRKAELIKDARAIIDGIAPAMFREQVRLIPGTAEALKGLAAGGIKLGLVTSTLRDYMGVKLAPLRAAGIEDLLEIVITADDVQNKKPHAEPLVMCSDRMGMAPQMCVYVGDTRVDIRAGNAAGMQTVGVLTGFDDYAALINESPNFIVDSVAGLRARLNLSET